MIVGRQARPHRLVGGRLQHGIDRGGDVVALVQYLAAELGHHFLADHLGHVGRIDVDRALVRRGVRLLGLGRGRLARADVVVFQHPVDHVDAALVVALRVADRIAAGGELQRAHQRGRLAQGQLVQRLAVVELRRRRHAVGAVAEETLVEVQLQDLVLGEHPLDAHGQHHLGQLAGVAVLVAQEELARHLLGDGAAAGHATVLGQRLPDRTRDAGRVDAAMFVEVRVLRGHERALDVDRHLADVDRVAAGLAKDSDQAAVIGIDVHRLLQLHVAQRLDRRQLGGDGVVEEAQDDGSHQGASQA